MKTLRVIAVAVLLALLGPASGWAGWQEPSVFPRPADPWKHWGRSQVVIVTPLHPHFAHPHWSFRGPGWVVPHPGFHRQPVWIPGHWVWTGFGWAWQPGHWAW
jgi:hypothetical protein